MIYMLDNFKLNLLIVTNNKIINSNYKSNNYLSIIITIFKKQ